uniref:Uncharacterized protein n=1 Tax=Chromera velia CCMP2878 TaxID=1169474 RepID=A0A0G4FAX6_9ALVE|eukprot:Cvel_16072.t1-p1 / transcript=Cvel_16072.t1 / gene=Cvel_16072 / organism=Chromera_velia_CCMP2878 / gene_product=hypothetical protein / transcript_product=hypothetical protein / location=Cvel_scaffold1221:48271-50004(-) / protein_length=578 / sequence_SO=supercontig / SO=protein_coding / is_pseudo=false
MSQFKTQPCNVQDPHDRAVCFGFHSDAERRGDPFKTPYFFDGARNKNEQMFHPSVYRTKMCGHKGTYPHGSLYAFAHSDAQLRDPSEGDKYESEFLLEKPKVRVLGDFFDETQLDSLRKNSSLPLSSKKQIQKWKKEIENLSGSAARLETGTLEMRESQAGLLRSSGVLRERIESIVLEKLCIVRSDVGQSGRHNLHFRGLKEKVRECVRDVRHLLQKPPEDCGLVEDCEISHFPPAVANAIREDLEKPRGACMLLRGPTSFWYEVVDGGAKLRCTATAAACRKAFVDLAFRSVSLLEDLAHVNRACEQQHNCSAYLERKRASEGVLCTGGHFWCLECMKPLFEDQLSSLRSTRSCLLCPIGRTAAEGQPMAVAAAQGGGRFRRPQLSVCQFRVQSLATRLPTEVFERFESARRDAVRNEVEGDVRVEFEEKLEKERQRILDDVGNRSDEFKQKVERLAVQIRDEVLNLCCLNCRAFYADFTGCMALKCESCMAHFCGWYHAYHGADLRSAHQHVRECLHNENSRKDYFGTPQEIETAQRKYRERAIKSFFDKKGGVKKDERNATLLLLEEHLRGLNV